MPDGEEWSRDTDTSWFLSLWHRGTYRYGKGIEGEAKKRRREEKRRGKYNDILDLMDDLPTYLKR